MRALAVARKPSALVTRWCLDAMVAGALPMTLAGATMLWLIPSHVGATVAGGWLLTIATVERRAPLPVFAGLFLFFGIIVRYWWDRLGRATSVGAMRQEGTRYWLLLLSGIAAAALIAVGVRNRVATHLVVTSGSMLPTLEPGDQVGERLLAYRSLTDAAVHRTPRRGDVIVFPTTAVPDDRSTQPRLVKRVIGLPGDRISMRGVTPMINGWLVPSCDAGAYLYFVPGGDSGIVQGRLMVEFLGDRAYLVIHTGEAPPSPDIYQVQPDEVFVLGDNRSNSVDSRGWDQGRGAGVPVGFVEGRVDRLLARLSRSGETDLGSVLTSVDSLAAHVEGADARELQEGIAHCLARRPGRTDPPPPEAATAGPQASQ